MIGIVVIGLLLMVLTGRLHWIGAIFAGILASFRTGAAFDYTLPSRVDTDVPKFCAKVKTT